MHISQSIIVPVCCSYVRMYIYIGMNNYWWVYMGVYNVQSLSPSNAWDCVLKTAVRVYICICICMYNRCPNTYNSLTPPPPLTLAELCRQCQCRCLSHTHTSCHLLFLLSLPLHTCSKQHCAVQSSDDYLTVNGETPVSMAAPLTSSAACVCSSGHVWLSSLSLK